VDFNVGLRVFEPLVASVRHLVNIAANAPISGGASILFTSSIGVYSGRLNLGLHLSATHDFPIDLPPDTPALEQRLTDPRYSVSSGYSQSKWVAEEILFRAREQSGIKATIVRVGQVAGDSRTGAWTEREWVPAMIRVAQVVGALPKRDDVIFYRLFASLRLKLRTGRFMGCGRSRCGVTHRDGTFI
jgi:thioester reductase-like protein